MIACEKVRAGTGSLSREFRHRGAHAVCRWPRSPPAAHSLTRAARPSALLVCGLSVASRGAAAKDMGTWTCVASSARTCLWRLKGESMASTSPVSALPPTAADAPRAHVTPGLSRAACATASQLRPSGSVRVTADAGSNRKRTLDEDVPQVCDSALGPKATHTRTD